MEPAHLALLGIVFGAYLVGSTLGFGSSILVVTFAAQLLPLDAILPVVAPLNIAVSGYLALRYRRETAWRVLGRRILPLAAVGVVAGLVLFNLREMGALKLAFGLFVIVLASGQLWMWRRGGARQPLRRGIGASLIFGGGVVHGLFGTGGPLIVYVIGREIADKGSFRSTLATMWVPLNIALVVDYVFLGLYDASVARLTGAAILPVALGLLLGEQAHARLDPERFKLGVWVLLLVGGCILSLRAVIGLVP